MVYTDVKSFLQLKEYLLQVRPLADNGDPVIRYRVVTKPWRNGPRPNETWVEAEIKGRLGHYKKFYGYLEDVFHNVNAGLLEPLDKRGDIPHTTNLKGETL